MTTFILIHGGNIESPRLAARAGWQYGVCSKDTVYGDCYMLDYDWTTSTPDAWQKHLAMLESHQPRQSVVFDYEEKTQYDVMMRRVDECVQRNVTPIVVPKFTNAAKDIPLYVGQNWNWNDMHRVIVGISVPTRDPGSDKFSGWLPTWQEVSGRVLHLLGGHPDQWNWLRWYYKESSVISIDGNAMLRKARRGQFWRRNEWGYRDVRGQGYSTNAMATYSMLNAVRYWRSGVVNHVCKRVLDCKQTLGLTPIQLSLFNEVA